MIQLIKYKLLYICKYHYKNNLIIFSEYISANSKLIIIIIIYILNNIALF